MKTIWKKALAVLLTAILVVGASPATGLVALFASAETVGGTCGADGGNLTWSLDTDTGVLTISGMGDMADYSEDDAAPWSEDYKDCIQSVTIGSGVTSIGDYAFSYHFMLTSATIGEDVTHIGEGAFALSALQSVNIPASVEEIENLAFVCLRISEDEEITPTIESITVDDANTSFSAQDGVLYDHTKTTLIQYPCGKPDISFSIPESVTALCDSAFFMNTLLQNVTIPDSVTEIGSSAFEGCYSLENVTLGSSLVNIGENAFSECVSLADVTIPGSVTQIGDSAFYECRNLKTLTIGSGVGSIGDSAFYNCESLLSIVIPDSVSVIGSGAFSFCENLESASIGQGVETIGAFAFSACHKLTSVTFNAIACSPMSYPFSDCVALQTVVLGSSVTVIPANAFSGLSALAEIEIPDSVTQIGSYAFQNCALESIHIPSTVTEIGEGAFDNCSNLVYICSESTDSAAKTYAEANGIRFRQCTGAGEDPSAKFFGTCGAEGGNVTWALDLNTGAMTVSGTGAMADYTSITETPWADFTDSIQAVTVENGVTSIGSRAFCACENLTGAAIGNDVTSIGSNAFASCARLSDVSLGSSVAAIGEDAFAECESLAAVTFPGSLQDIGDGAFEFCMNLSDATLPEGLTTIGEAAFLYTALTSVSVPSTVQQIGTLAFVGVVDDGTEKPAVTLQQIDVDPNNTSYTSESGVLYNKSKTTLIQYPGAKPNDVFDIPASVTEIGANAFVFAVNLETVTIPDHVAVIGEDAFEYCTRLDHISIPEGVTEIADSTFSDCISLSGVTIPSTVSSIGKYAFDSCALTELTIPNSVKSIGDRAFNDCASLSNVTFGTSLEIIGANAFSSTALVNVILPDNVTQIGANAFSACKNLESTHIPASAKSIGEGAFSGCTSLSFICSDLADCYAKEYAAENSIDFRLCAGHTSSADTIHGTCGAQGDNVLWALNLGSGEMVISGAGAMADYASTNDTPWADYRTSIQSVTILSGVTNIGSYAFCGCTPLTNATIGEDVTAVGAYAFARSALTNVVIPRSVQTIGEDAFDCRTNFGGVVPTLQTFAVDPANVTFCAVDGVLYNKAQTTLILYPAGDPRVTFSVPDSVTNIEDFAFKNAAALTSIHVPASVTRIGTGAFSVCSRLEYICCDTDACYAKTYAAEYCIPFRLCVGHNGATRIAGDANGDGIVNLKDAVLMRRYLAGGWDVTIFAACADVDGDSSVTLQDVTLVCRYLAGGWDVTLS